MAVDDQVKDREQSTGQVQESRLTSGLIKGKVALWDDIRGINMPVKEILLMPHWSSKSFNQSLKQLQEREQLE